MTVRQTLLEEELQSVENKVLQMMRNFDELEEKTEENIKNAKNELELFTKSKLDNELAATDTKLLHLRQHVASKYSPIQQTFSHQYFIGAEACPAMFAPTVTEEIKILELKELKAGDGVFVLRSNTKWTYAILQEKEVLPNGIQELRFRVGNGLYQIHQMKSEQDWNVASHRIRLPWQHENN